MSFRDRIRPFVPARLRRLRHALFVVKNASYNTDGLMTIHDADFLRDPLFREAYRLGKETGSWGLSELPWRTYIICWAARHALALRGDFVECGVNRGGSSRAAMHYIDFPSHPDRQFYLLDTFCGFPAELTNVATKRNLNDYSECFEEVVQTFSGIQNVHLIRGKIPDTLSQVPAKSIAWLHIDMNVAEPEIAAAEYFWEKLVPGAIMLLDDYGFGEPYWRQKEAMNKFAAQKNVQILMLPTGQGLIIKP